MLIISRPVRILLHLIVFILLLDSLWLGILAKNTYQKTIRRVIGAGTRATIPLRVYSVALSYLALVIGLYFFVIPKIDQETPLVDSIYWGGLFGLITYGIFNFTNHALFPGWDLDTSLMDLMWGVFLSISVTYLTSTGGLGLI